MLEEGWEFRTDFPGATGDRLMGLRYLRDVYLRADPECSGRVTVPVLWDSERSTIVSNESSEIVRMLNSAFDALTGHAEDFWPEALRDEIEAVNARVYEHVNNGVYKAGFATLRRRPMTKPSTRSSRRSIGSMRGSQAARSSWASGPRRPIGGSSRRWCGSTRSITGTSSATVAGWWDYENLWPYARRLHQWPGVRETVRPDHYVRHYHYSHATINPHRIVPIGPEIDWDEPVPDAPRRAA